MANWVEGTLRVRGTIEKLSEFIERALEPVSFRGEDIGHLEADAWNDGGLTGLCAVMNGETELSDDLYLKGTHRNFIDMKGREIEATTKAGGKATLCLLYRAAWQIQAEPLLELCKEFQVDMRIMGFECGAEFARDIEIIGGQIIKDKQIEYDDWRWDCPLPLLGG